MLTRRVTVYWAFRRSCDERTMLRSSTVRFNSLGCSSRALAKHRGFSGFALGSLPASVKHDYPYRIVEHNGVKLRVVRPYVYEFNFRFKQRDENNRKVTSKSRNVSHLTTSIKQLFEFQSGVLELSEFQLVSLRNAIGSKLILVNGHPIANEEHVLKNGDALHRVWHRHERAVRFVPALDMIIEESREWVAINKPSTVPVHPGGAYRYNSLKYIVECEIPRLKDQLYLVHRLDRLTSGLILFAKSPSYASFLSKYIQNKQGWKMRKTYLARVKGRFDPSTFPPETRRISLAHSDREWMYVSSAVTSVFPRRSFTEAIPQGEAGEDDAGKESTSRFMFLGYDADSDTSLVKCEPITGRTHQLRIHLRSIGFPIANDPMYGGDASQEEAWSKHIERSVSHRDDEAKHNHLIDERTRLVQSICLTCREPNEDESINHRWIFLHSIRIRLLSPRYDSESKCWDVHNLALDQEFTAPLPEWIEPFRIAGLEEQDLLKGDDAKDDHL